MEDAFHCNFASVVVCVDRFWVMRPAGWVARLSGGQEGFDSFVSEDEQRSHRSEPGWERLVAAGVGRPCGPWCCTEVDSIERRKWGGGLVICVRYLSCVPGVGRTAEGRPLCLS